MFFTIPIDKIDEITNIDFTISESEYEFIYSMFFYEKYLQNLAVGQHSSKCDQCKPSIH